MNESEYENQWVQETESALNSVEAEQATLNDAIETNSNSTFWAAIKRRIFLIGAGAAAILLLVVLLVGGKGYMKPINRLVNELNKGTKSDWVSISLAYLHSEYRSFSAKNTTQASAIANSSYYSNVNKVPDYLFDAFMDLSDEYQNWKLSFAVSNAKKLPKSEVKTFQKKYRNSWKDTLEEFSELDYDELGRLNINVPELKKYVSQIEKFAKHSAKAKITAGYTVKGRYVLKNGNTDIDETNELTLYVLKINGDWAVYSSKGNELFAFRRSNSKHYKEYSFLSTFMNTFLDKAI